MNIAYYPRPEILARPELDQGHAVIEASAGTGKTFTLEHLVLDLIINDKADIEEILVVTFTDAATRELRERVRALIRTVCDRAVSEPPGDSSACWKIDDAVRGRLREALFRFDGAAISTIHGFCQRVLSEQAFLGGRLFEQEHADGSELFGLAFRDEVRTVLAEESPLGATLRRWIEEDKTLQSLQDLLYRCHREGCPDRCPVTPTYDPQGFFKALKELPPAEALKEAGSELYPDRRTYTVFEKHIDSLVETGAAMLNTDDPLDAASFFMEWAGYRRTLDRITGPQIENLNRAANEPGAPGVLRDLAAGLEKIAERAANLQGYFAAGLLPRVQARLTARKRALGLIDYDDMLLGVREALLGAGAPVLIEALRRRWKYALVDEFQDTDPVQWEIFRRIFVEGTDRHRLFIIGDPKQAIYSFRGADVYTYEQAKNHLVDHCGASRLPLRYNFRSTGPLIEAVNAILTAQDGAENTFFSGLNRYDEPAQCGDQSRRAVDEKGNETAPVHLLHLHGGGEKLNARSLRNGLACFIAEEIGRLVSPGTRLLTAGGSRDPAPIRLSDIYILTRSGREGRDIGEVLRGYGIPHAFYKQEGLFQTAEAGDVHKLLCAIDSPTDPAARMPAWLTPFFGIPLERLAAWNEAGDSHPLVAVLLEWKKLADLQAWSRLFEAVLTESGLMRRLVFSQDERALTNYLHLFELLQAEAHSRPVTLGELARGLKARIDGRKLPEGREGDVQRLETDKEAVQILTIHKAKGLEAEVVFIGGGFGNPPAGDTEMNIYHRDGRRCLHIGRATGEIMKAVDREIDEENQRLVYVAITRAGSRLYLPYFGAAPESGNGADEDSYGYKSLGRFYGGLQKQLDLLRQSARLTGQGGFVLRNVSCRRPPAAEQEPEIEPDRWADENLPELPPSKAAAAARIEAGHRGVLLTSYTRIKGGKSWQPLAPEEDARAELRSEEVAGEAGATGTPPEDETGLELPGGRETGIFIHALLEEIPVEEIKDLSYEKWSALQAVRERAEAAARRHGFSEQYVPPALQLAYSALRAPVQVQSLDQNSVLLMPGGIASGEHHRAEMSFAYPIPEAFHPLLHRGSGAGAGWASGTIRQPYGAVRGYLQGLVDLVFEHEGRTYLLDWKSDSLPAFDLTSLDTHVAANYSLQARIYALAVVRLLGIGSREEFEAAFGGVLYAFIRGISPPAGNGEAGTGFWYLRPAWDELAAWEQELLERREWGGAVIRLDGDRDAAGTERGDNG